MPGGARADEYHEVEFRLKDAASGDWRWYRSRAVAIKTPEGDIVEWITAMRDVHEPRIARERNAILLGEARHRLKNLIAIIAALATSSRPPRGEVNAQSEEFLKRFLGRLHALGAAADLALVGDNRVMELGEAIEATLAPFNEGRVRIAISGPRAILGQETGGSIALAVHELATNALKYGALSDPDGSVSLAWSLTPLGENERIEIVWKEFGGPSVSPPEKEGYGYRVIRAAVSRGRESRAEVTYAPEGLSWELSFVQPANRSA
jgi:two-component sensor histidine kinase